MKKISLLFNLVYIVALLSCFIVNLSVSKTLSWFFIVFVAIIPAFTLTSLWSYVKKYKLFIISLSFLGSIILLLGVICIYTGGDWFYVTISPIILGYLIIFVPILINVYDLPEIIKRHSALISFIIDLFGLLLMLFVINSYTSGDWLFNVAYPIVFVSSLIPFLIIIINRYLNINWSFKLSLNLLVIAVTTGTLHLFIDYIVKNEQNYKYDLSNWSNGEYISGNTNLIVVLSLSLFAVIFGLIGLLISKRK